MFCRSWLGRGRVGTGRLWRIRGSALCRGIPRGEHVPLPLKEKKEIPYMKGL